MLGPGCMSVGSYRVSRVWAGTGVIQERPDGPRDDQTLGSDHREGREGRDVSGFDEGVRQDHENLAKGFVATLHPVAVKRIADLQKEGYLYIKP
jgi:hypothetical protein